MTSPFRSPASNDPSGSPDWQPMQAWIQANRQHLDTELPSEMAWPNIKSQLAKNETPVRTLWTGWRAVAAALLLGGASMFILDKVGPENLGGNLAPVIPGGIPGAHTATHSARLPQSIAALESHYLELIDKEKAKLKEHKAPDSSISTAFIQREKAILNQLEILRKQIESGQTVDYRMEIQWGNLRSEQLLTLQEWNKAIRDSVPEPALAR